MSNNNCTNFFLDSENLTELCPSMNVYFSSHSQGEFIFLSEQEALHAVKVMRMKEGDSIFITNGNGSLFECVIENNHAKNFTAKIIKEEKQAPAPYYLEIAIAPTKNMDRLEWFIEKSVEMGIHRIIPIVCHRSERKVVKHERVQSIVLAAMKQSLKFHATTIEEAITLKEFIHQPFDGQRFICHCEPTEKNAPSILQQHSRVQILIGPEGDFSPEEILLATQQNALPLSLGESRLRTETAGVLSTAAMYLYHGKK